MTTTTTTTAAEDEASSPLPDATHHHQRHDTPNDLRCKHQDHNEAASTSLSSSSTTTSSSSAAVAVEAAAAAALHDKDLRIRHLENELLNMETEFHTQLDRLAQAESETATYWQAKYSALNQQFLRTDTELRLLRQQHDAREGEREELRAGCERLRRTLAGREEEAARLRAQVRGLKEFVSTSTRSDGTQAASDEVFAEGMGKLANGLQNWVITSYRRGRLRAWGEVDGDVRAQVAGLCPVYEEVARRGGEGKVKKVYLLQGIVAAVLVEMVWGGYYAGLGAAEEERLRGVEAMFTGLGLSAEPVNQWRASTLALLRREAPWLQDVPGELTGQVAARILALLSGILHLPAALPPSAEGALRQLVTSAVELARWLSVQKAVLRVLLPTVHPHERVLFDRTTMEDVGGEEIDEEGDDGEEGDAGREICCAVFPGLVKRGDENGGSLEWRNVIAKARVLCVPLGE